MLFLRKNFFIVFFVAAIFTLVACGGNDEGEQNSADGEAAAIVNGEEIPLDFLEQQVDSMRQFYSQQGIDLDSDEYEETLQEIRMDLLNDIVREKVLVQEADRHDIEPTEEEIDMAVEQMLVEYDTTEEELQSAMEEQGYSDEMFRQEVKDQLKIQKLTDLDHLDFEDFDVTEENLRAYYDEIIAQYGEEIGEYDELLVELEASYVWDSYVQQLMEDAEVEIYI
ncbi:MULTISPECIES: SurA N-terminal domain-containing protein [Bacillaceae]|uniref:SurA N-terminal domain-containing protein n=1 Tax=Evansella alkalicola TaxID=745819 RepID=A0ABS6K0M8_9BACI|nr:MULTISPECIES: SurA N-terminal domain-containing protein [Bacillaceae]MBU9723997.1 SurA N-terminal domain-containing protein [Bacillus alkalicola]